MSWTDFLLVLSNEEVSARKRRGSPRHGSITDCSGWFGLSSVLRPVGTSTLRPMTSLIGVPQGAEMLVVLVFLAVIAAVVLVARRRRSQNSPSSGRASTPATAQPAITSGPRGDILGASLSATSSALGSPQFAQMAASQAAKVAAALLSKIKDDDEPGFFMPTGLSASGTIHSAGVLVLANRAIIAATDGTTSVIELNSITEVKTDKSTKKPTTTVVTAGRTVTLVHDKIFGLVPMPLQVFEGFLNGAMSWEK